MYEDGFDYVCTDAPMETLHNGREAAEIRGIEGGEGVRQSNVEVYDRL